jgi:hypothetical protein
METISGDITVGANHGLMITMAGTIETEIPPIKATLQRVGNILSQGGSVSI